MKIKIFSIIFLVMIGVSFGQTSLAALPSLVPEECRYGAYVRDVPKTEIIECVHCEVNTVDRTNCCCDLSSIEMGFLNIANIILGISGSLALLMFVYGGVMYIFAGGNSSYAEKGKNALVYATIGLVVVLGAGVIIKSIFRALAGG